MSSEAPEDDMENAIMAIRRNGVALKGMRSIWLLSPHPRASHSQGTAVLPLCPLPGGAWREPPAPEPVAL